jgi:hypothetical protein
MGKKAYMLVELHVSQRKGLIKQNMRWYRLDKSGLSSKIEGLLFFKEREINALQIWF